MKISIGRFRLRIGVEERRSPEPDRASRDLQDHEIATLREAEQGLREQIRVSNSLLSGNW
jgi:hypothetical protein